MVDNKETKRVEFTISRRLYQEIQDHIMKSNGIIEKGSIKCFMKEAIKEKLKKS